MQEVNDLMIKNKKDAAKNTLQAYASAPTTHSSIDEILSRNTEVGLNRDNTLSVSPFGTSSTSASGYTITTPSSTLTNAYTITTPFSTSTSEYTITTPFSDRTETITAKSIRHPRLVEKEYAQLAVRILPMIVTRRQQIDQDDFKKQEPFKYRDLMNEIDNDEFYLLSVIEAYVNDEYLPNDVEKHLGALEQKYM